MIKKQVTQQDKLFLIDGHALSYRSFYAIKELSNSKGQMTNAVYGFINTLRKIIKEFKPAYLAVCFDSKEKTFRQKKFADYKIQRPAMPDGLISQLPLIKDVMEAFNIPVFECPGYEADDIIATLTKKFSHDELEVVIVSEDKDMFQLADKNVCFFSARKDEVFGRDELSKRLGFDPGHMIDFIGLAGDKADNIPGVAGVGEVTARKLINEFGSIENIYSRVDELKPEKLREKMLNEKEKAVLSKELALLDEKAPVDFSLEKMAISEPDQQRLYELFMELEFKRLAQEFSNASTDSQVTDCNKLKGKEEVKKLCDQIKNKGLFAYILEEDATKDSGLFIALDDQVYFISESDVIGLEGLWNDPEVMKICYNLKENLKKMAFPPSTFGKGFFDLLLAGYLLEPAQSRYDLSQLDWDYNQQSLPDQIDSAQKAKVSYSLYEPMAKELEKRSLRSLLDDVEVPLAYVLYLMEDYGVKLDVALLNKLSKEAEKEIDRLSVDLYKMAGEEFNLNSPKQLSKILFEKLNLPVIKKTKTGFSTNEEVLTILSNEHEFPSLILSYRQLAKLRSTYLDALPKLVDEKTGKIHTQFNQVQAETGRLSSVQPNLQNIPVRTELGRKIRAAIIPSKKEWTMLSADYSQIELRILAHLSQDKNLIKAFECDQDIHQFTASLMFDLKEKDVTREMRYSAKRVNFGIIYGMSAFGLAKDLGVTQKEAQDFINRYFSRYPGVKEFMDLEIKKCEEKGYVQTLLKRRRYIPEINSNNIGVRQFAQRQAINTPVQGSAADLMKLAMIDIQKAIEKAGFSSRMLITVHDELVFDVEPKEQDELVTLIREKMESSMKLLVPVKVTVKEGRNWLDMKEVQ